MKVGVISDTHDQIHRIREAMQIFAAEGVELLVHCGDWVSPFSLRLYADLKVPIKGVFGNNDGDKLTHFAVAKKIGLDFHVEEKKLELEVDHRRLVVTHGDFPGIVELLTTCGKYDVVLHGHTHRRVNEKVGKTLSLNPGSFMDKTSDTVKGASLAIYDTRTNEAHHMELLYRT